MRTDALVLLQHESLRHRWRLGVVTGRTLARILLGLGSALFPSELFWDTDWWAKYAQCNFAEVAKHAQAVIDEKRKSS